MRCNRTGFVCAVGGLVCALAMNVSAQQKEGGESPAPSAAQDSGAGSGQAVQQLPSRDYVFDMGEIVVVGATQEGQPGVGGAILSREEMWTYDRNTLDRAVNVIPGVVSTFDANGRRHESDIFVAGFVG